MASFFLLLRRMHKLGSDLKDVQSGQGLILIMARLKILAFLILAELDLKVCRSGYLGLFIMF